MEPEATSGIDAAAAQGAAQSPSGRLAPAAWAVADQALFAGGNFLLNILLARWLEPSTYGAFAVGLAVLFLLGSMHVALLGEPLLVFGASRFADRQRAYLGAVFIGHWVVAGPVVLLMVVAGIVFLAAGSRELGIALIGLGVCSPFVLLLWLGRRASYLTGTPRRAAIAGAAYLVLIAAMLGGLFVLQRVTLPAAMLVIGISSAIAGGGLAWEMRTAMASADRGLFREAAGAHLAYGRWSAMTNLVFFLSGQAMILVVATFAGLDAGGGLRAILNLITPMHLVIAAMVTLLVPVFARATRHDAHRVMMRTTLLLAASAGMYALLLGLAQRPLFRIIYAGQYVAVAPAVWLLGATLLGSAVADVSAAVLRARQRPDQVLIAYLAAAVVCLGGGIGLTIWRGLPGAALAMALGSASAAVVLWVLARRRA